MTLVVGLTEQPPFVLVVEEPETNLHPAAQRALLGLFQSWALERLIVVATHSTVMLDWSPGGDRLWLVKRSEGVSDVAAVDIEPMSVFTSLGVRLSDVLSAERVLVVEGPTDEDLLSIWFPALLRDPRVAVVNGGGGDNARHAPLLAAWLQQADKLRRRILYVRDRDELPASVIERLSSSGAVYILNRRELENYLLDARALAVVLGTIIADDMVTPTPSTVRQVMEEAAEGLRRAIVVNRVVRQLPLVQLVDHPLRQRLAREGADLGQVTTALLERMPDEQDLRRQIGEWWQQAQDEVSRHHGDDLLRIAPGADLLDAVFMRFAGRRFKKREHGMAVAKEMHEPPSDLREILDAFVSADIETSC